jgi:hypothetical protein
LGEVAGRLGKSSTGWACARLGEADDDDDDEGASGPPRCCPLLELRASSCFSAVVVKSVLLSSLSCGDDDKEIMLRRVRRNWSSHMISESASSPVFRCVDVALSIIGQQHKC